MKVNLQTNKDLSDYLVGLVQPHATALQGILDKLPEALKPDFLKLKKDLDAQLAKLAPTDQVPAALDAANALQSFCYAMERMQEYALEASKRLVTITGSLSEANGKNEAFEKQVKDGELISKAAATELCGAARQEALATVKPLIATLRKQQAESAGVPAPLEELLGLSDADYAPRFEQAKLNVLACVKRGLQVGGRGSAIIRDLAWLPATEFNGKLTSYEDVLGKERTAGDPLLGGGGGGGAAEKKPAGKARLW